MRVFISWSGDRAGQLAEAVRAWLPKVIQRLAPWASSADIVKGARWLGEIQEHLRDSRFGLICVTPENQMEPWLLFEAGALSNALGTELVAPLLLGLEPSALRPPLSQFQATSVEKEDVRKLVQTLNSRLVERPLPERQVDESFEVWWPKLEGDLNRIAPTAGDPQRRTDRAIAEETLAIARNLGRRLGLDRPPQLEPLRRLLHALPTAREERIVRMRLGIGEPTNYTVEQVAEAFGLSPERIRKIERKALRQLLEAEPVGDEGEEPTAT